MNISSVAPLAVTRQADQASDSPSSSDSPSNFAAVLSGMMTPPEAPKPPADKAAEGTSDLDGSSNADGQTDGAKGPGETTSRDSRMKAAKNAKDANSATAAGADAAANGGIARSLALVAPELQARVSRVMERMKEETGQDVVVTETLRSQARQNALFAQGRDVPGRVVTWTQHSKHTEGLAVDVTLPGGGAQDYAALQRIATEEGLHTLGARDPGHLELPTAGAASTLTPGGAGAADAHASIPVARVAELARVASVASVSVAAANVATPARIAAPARPAAIDTTPAAAAGISTRSPYGPRTETSSHDHQRGDDGSDARDDRRSGYADALSAVRRSEYGSTVRAMSDTSAPAPGDRVSDMLDARDASPAARLAQITLAVDGDAGSTQEVQLSLRGRALSASIEAADSTGVHRMTSSAPELARALARDGIDLQQLHVRAAAPAAVLAADTSRGSNNDSRGGDRSARQPFQQDGGQGQRRQSQREQRGGRQQ